MNLANWRLTKHGRARFIERVAIMSDKDIVETARGGVMMGFCRGSALELGRVYYSIGDLALRTVDSGK